MESGLKKLLAERELPQTLDFDFGSCSKEDLKSHVETIREKLQEKQRYGI